MEQPQGIIFSPGGRDVRNYLKQFLPREWWPKLTFPLTDDAYRWETKILSVDLSTSSTTGSDSYEIPQTHIGLIFKIAAHLGIDDFSAESLAVSNVGNPTITDRLFMKGMNCRVTLQNADKGDYIIGGTVGGGEAAALSDIMPQLGNGPKLYDPPLIVGSGEVIQADMTLNDTASDVVGASSEYGFAVDILLLRRGR